MGVYSEIAIKVYGSEQAAQEFFDLFDERFHQITNQETKNEILYLMNESEETTGRPVFDMGEEEQFVFYLDSVKWYSGLPAIDFFINLFDTAKSIPELNGEYLHIQEETEIFEDSFGNECNNTLKPSCTISGL